MNSEAHVSQQLRMKSGCMASGMSDVGGDNGLLLAEERKKVGRNKRSVSGMDAEAAWELGLPGFVV